MKKHFLPLLVFLLIAFNEAGAADINLQAKLEKKNSPESSGNVQNAGALFLKEKQQAVEAGIPAEDVEIIIQRGLGRNIDPNGLKDLIDISIQVRRRHLPARIVLDRIQQGLSKGVPLGRILQVTRELSAKLEISGILVKDLVRNGVRAGNDGEREEIIQVVARALEGSISKESLLRLGKETKEYRRSLSVFSQAVDTMTSLTGNGMAVEQATGLMSKALHKGYLEKDFFRLERDITQELKSGRQMEETVKRADSLIERGGWERNPQEINRSPVQGPNSGYGSKPDIGGTGAGAPSIFGEPKKSGEGWSGNPSKPVNPGGSGWGGNYGGRERK